MLFLCPGIVTGSEYGFGLIEEVFFGASFPLLVSLAGHLISRAKSYS
jgi:hypothetical protein